MTTPVGINKKHTEWRKYSKTLIEELKEKLEDRRTRTLALLSENKDLTAFREIDTESDGLDDTSTNLTIKHELPGDGAGAEGCLALSSYSETSSLTDSECYDRMDDCFYSEDVVKCEGECTHSSYSTSSASSESVIEEEICSSTSTTCAQLASKTRVNLDRHDVIFAAGKLPADGESENWPANEKRFLSAKGSLSHCNIKTSVISLADEALNVRLTRSFTDLHAVSCTDAPQENLKLNSDDITAQNDASGSTSLTKNINENTDQPDVIKTDLYKPDSPTKVVDDEGIMACKIKEELAQIIHEVVGTSPSTAELIQSLDGVDLVNTNIPTDEPPTETTTKIKTERDKFPDFYSDVDKDSCVGSSEEKTHTPKKRDFPVPQKENFDCKNCFEDIYKILKGNADIFNDINKDIIACLEHQLRDPYSALRNVSGNSGYMTVKPSELAGNFPPTQGESTERSKHLSLCLEKARLANSLQLKIGHTRNRAENIATTRAYEKAVDDLEECMQEFFKSYPIESEELSALQLTSAEATKRLTLPPTSPTRDGMAASLRRSSTFVIEKSGSLSPMKSETKYPSSGSTSKEKKTTPSVDSDNSLINRDLPPKCSPTYILNTETEDAANSAQKPEKKTWCKVKRSSSFKSGYVWSSGKMHAKKTKQNSNFLQLGSAPASDSDSTDSCSDMLEDSACKYTSSMLTQLLDYDSQDDDHLPDDVLALAVEETNKAAPETLKSPQTPDTVPDLFTKLTSEKDLNVMASSMTLKAAEVDDETHGNYESDFNTDSNGEDEEIEEIEEMLKEEVDENLIGIEMNILDEKHIIDEKKTKDHKDNVKLDESIVLNDDLKKPVDNSGINATGTLNLSVDDTAVIENRQAGLDKVDDKLTSTPSKDTSEDEAIECSSKTLVARGKMTPHISRPSHRKWFAVNNVGLNDSEDNDAPFLPKVEWSSSDEDILDDLRRDKSPSDILKEKQKVVVDEKLKMLTQCAQRRRKSRSPMRLMASTSKTLDQISIHSNSSKDSGIGSLMFPTSSRKAIEPWKGSQVKSECEYLGLPTSIYSSTCAMGDPKYFGDYDNTEILFPSVSELLLTRISQETPIKTSTNSTMNYENTENDEASLITEDFDCAMTNEPTTLPIKLSDISPTRIVQPSTTRKVASIFTAESPVKAVETPALRAHQTSREPSSLAVSLEHVSSLSSTSGEYTFPPLSTSCLQGESVPRESTQEPTGCIFGGETCNEWVHRPAESLETVITEFNDDKTQEIGEDIFYNDITQDGNQTIGQINHSGNFCLHDSIVIEESATLRKDEKKYAPRNISSIENIVRLAPCENSTLNSCPIPQMFMNVLQNKPFVFSTTNHDNSFQNDENKKSASDNNFVLSGDKPCETITTEYKIEQNLNSLDKTPETIQASSYQNDDKFDDECKLERDGRQSTERRQNENLLSTQHEVLNRGLIPVISDRLPREEDWTYVGDSKDFLSYVQANKETGRCKPLTYKAVNPNFQDSRSLRPSLARPWCSLSKQRSSAQQIHRDWSDMSFDSRDCYDIHPSAENYCLYNSKDPCQETHPRNFVYPKQESHLKRDDYQTILALFDKVSSIEHHLAQQNVNMECVQEHPCKRSPYSGTELGTCSSREAPCRSGRARGYCCTDPRPVCSCYCSCSCVSKQPIDTAAGSTGNTIAKLHTTVHTQSSQTEDNKGDGLPDQAGASLPSDARQVDEAFVEHFQTLSSKLDTSYELCKSLQSNLDNIDHGQVETLRLAESNAKIFAEKHCEQLKKSMDCIETRLEQLDHTHSQASAKRDDSLRNLIKETLDSVAQHLASQFLETVEQIEQRVTTALNNHSQSLTNKYTELTHIISELKISK
ncbi:uncharacterized protein LOC131939208 [Physella acuta]|uniref:uncharacterized protein LOC131939208 n=1 Tax=Physella acuta TaxID=109671 RepID=UPI0027DE9DEC|nr:uncharacterized protein LOC131939208 [Physella acuta]